jgi:hypothetical protein
MEEVYEANYRPKIGIAAVVIALFIIAWGVVWLGNDMKWWDIPFPIWPVALILLGLAILFGQIRKLF